MVEERRKSDNVLNIIEDTVKKIIKPLSLFHGAISIVLLIGFIFGGLILGYFTYKNFEITKNNTNQLELVNKYYILQNQSTILLKVIDQNLRESSTSKPGSASMELKIQTAKMMYDMSQVKNVPLNIICGIAETESGWNTHAVSNTGCVGLMQITPLYARVYLREKGINYKPDIWFDPTINVMCGISMLDDAQEEYVEEGKTKPDDWQIAIHSYFWGAANTNLLFNKNDARLNIPNMAYPMRVVEASKKYKELGL